MYYFTWCVIPYSASYILAALYFCSEKLHYAVAEQSQSGESEEVWASSTADSYLEECTMCTEQHCYDIINGMIQQKKEISVKKKSLHPLQLQLSLLTSEKLKEPPPSLTLDVLLNDCYSIIFHHLITMQLFINHAMITQLPKLCTSLIMNIIIGIGSAAMGIMVYICNAIN